VTAQRDRVLRFHPHVSGNLRAQPGLQRAVQPVGDHAHARVDFLLARALLLEDHPRIARLGNAAMQRQGVPRVHLHAERLPAAASRGIGLHFTNG
jgi:hypothetical protein